MGAGPGCWSWALLVLVLEALENLEALEALEAQEAMEASPGSWPKRSKVGPRGQEHGWIRLLSTIGKLLPQRFHLLH